MTKRPEVSSDFPGQISKVNELLDTFMERIENGDVRQQVLALVPVVHAVRSLGCSLVEGEGRNAARNRVLAYFLKYPRTLIDGDELLVVSGIGEWARRVRELRVEYGWSIYTGMTLAETTEETPEILVELRSTLGTNAYSVRSDQYILMKCEQDREAALRWNQINIIRKKPGGTKAKILEYFRLNAGHVLTGEELRYLAKENKEWARRIRELRTEDGWPIFTKMQGRPDLDVGEYLLEEDRQAEKHDRRIPDAVRVAVLERDAASCTYCGWKREDLTHDDPRKFLELHHLDYHSKGGANSLENLKTLCNVHHDQVHRGTLVWETGRWVENKN